MSWQKGDGERARGNAQMKRASGNLQYMVWRKRSGERACGNPGVLIHHFSAALVWQKGPGKESFRKSSVFYNFFHRFFIKLLSFGGKWRRQGQVGILEFWQNESLRNFNFPLIFGRNFVMAWRKMARERARGNPGMLEMRGASQNLSLLSPFYPFVIV